MNSTSEKPLIMSGASVIATLADLKHQTRRVAKLRPHPTGHDWHAPFYQDGYWIFTAGFGLAMRQQRIKCPYGQVGGEMWCRETWAIGSFQPKLSEGTLQIVYRAGVADAGHPDGATVDYEWRTPSALPTDTENHKWRPSIFMPRWASRITLEITGVRVERLKQITEGDAESEGMDGHAPEDRMTWKTPREQFAELWDSLNQKRGYGWDSNCWVWVLDYKRVEVLR